MRKDVSAQCSSCWNVLGVCAQAGVLLFELKYPLDAKIMTTEDWATYCSSASIDFRSSTSRKIEAPGSMILSCRLIVAHWSCPLAQT